MSVFANKINAEVLFLNFTLVTSELSSCKRKHENRVKHSILRKRKEFHIQKRNK